MPRGRPRKRLLTEDELINGLHDGSAALSDEIADAEADAKATTDKAPKRSPGRPGKSLEKPIAQIVDTANSVVAVISPLDVLDENEGALLVKGLDQAQQSDPRMRKLFTGIASKSGKLTLIYAVTVIAFTRLARRGMIPESLVKSMTKNMEPEPAAAPAPVVDIAAYMRDDNGIAWSQSAPVQPVYAE